jgi:septum formation protein
MKRIILASSSPRRKELLKKLGITFKITPSNIEEKITEGIPPEQLAKRLAYKKAKAVADKIKSGLVIGADTIVVVKGRIIGKPTSFEDAQNMLKLLSDTAHKVITGIAIIDAKTKRSSICYETSTVKIRRIKKKDIERLARLHLDKAGSYAAQEDNDALIEKVDGNFCNVVGLPIKKLKKMLENFGA